VRIKEDGQMPLTILQAEHMKGIPWLVHGFSARLGGFSSAYGQALNLGFTKDDSRVAVERNRSVFLRTLGAFDQGQPWPLITLRQIHSDVIHQVTSAADGHLVGDGLITSTPGLLLAVQTADCLPIVLIDPKCRAVGVFHAGWRGTLQRIVDKGVGTMCLRFGSHPHELKAAIGPGIHQCCYEVGLEVKEKFDSQFEYAAELFREVNESDPVHEKYPLLFLSARPPGHSELPAKLFLNLVEANRRQMVAAGIRDANIEASPLCTSCRVDVLFSYRAEKGNTGRMMGVVGIRG
jgi:polyphenol oxidase